MAWALELVLCLHDDNNNWLIKQTMAICSWEQNGSSRRGTVTATGGMCMKNRDNSRASTSSIDHCGCGLDFANDTDYKCMGYGLQTCDANADMACVWRRQYCSVCARQQEVPVMQIPMLTAVCQCDAYPNPGYHTSQMCAHSIQAKFLKVAILVDDQVRWVTL